MAENLNKEVSVYIIFTKDDHFQVSVWSLFPIPDICSSIMIMAYLDSELHLKQHVVGLHLIGEGQTGIGRMFLTV